MLPSGILVWHIMCYGVILFEIMDLFTTCEFVMSKVMAFYTLATQLGLYGGYASVL